MVTHLFSAYRKHKKAVEAGQFLEGLSQLWSNHKVEEAEASQAGEMAQSITNARVKQ